MVRILGQVRDGKQVSYDVTTPEGRKELRRIWGRDGDIPILLDYVDELEGLVADLRDENEELTEMLADVPRRYIDRMRSDV